MTPPVKQPPLNQAECNFLDLYGLGLAHMYASSWKILVGQTSGDPRFWELDREQDFNTWAEVVNDKPNAPGHLDKGAKRI